jgi:hypothetical protein
VIANNFFSQKAVFQDFPSEVIEKRSAMDMDSDSGSFVEWAEFLLDSSVKKRLLGRSIWVHELNLQHDELGM